MRETPVKLQRPTDFLILEYLDEGGRNVATNIAAGIDKSRSHVNVRLPVLHDYDLVKKIGPVENSGLYEITDRGRVAVEYQDQYGEDDVDFDQLIDEKVGELDEDTEREATAD